MPVYVKSSLIIRVKIISTRRNIYKNLKLKLNEELCEECDRISSPGGLFLKRNVSKIFIFD